MYDEITINDELDRDNLDWLLHISTRTGISVSGDNTITDDFARLVISTIKNQDKEIERLNNRIDKAIEYIEENYDNATYTYSKDKDIYCKCFDDLLDTLKGSKKD